MATPIIPSGAEARPAAASGTGPLGGTAPGSGSGLPTASPGAGGAVAGGTGAGGLAGRPSAAATIWRWREEAPGAAGDPAALEAARRARLRREGLIRAAVGLVVAALLALWKPLFAAIVASIALIVLLLALASPTGAYARLSGWVERFAHGVGMAVTWLLMPILYYLLFLPVGLARRVFGKIRFETRPDPRQPTYWSQPPAGRRWGGGAAAAGSAAGSATGSATGAADGSAGGGIAPYRRQF